MLSIYFVRDCIYHVIEELESWIEIYFRRFWQFESFFDPNFSMQSSSFLWMIWFYY